MLVQLLNGAYSARSVIASAQRCVNLYPEVNHRATILSPYMPQQTAPTLMTHYPTPGLTKLAQAPLGPVRGLYRGTNDVLYMVSGNTFYSVDPYWNLTTIGTIPYNTTPVSMMDNGQTLVLVDGTSTGYKYQNAGFSTITDAAFYGADRVDYVDTFFVFNRPGLQTWYCSLSNSISFDPLYLANKTGYADNLKTLVVCQRQIWLIGELTTEVWYDAGNSDFPFSPVPGAFIQHGTIAKYSAATHDVNVFWLSQDKEGHGIVLMGSGYQAERISTHAMENEFNTYTTLTDAVGACYQQEGHKFYVLTFPTADKTWVYDVDTELWHERAWLDSNGVEHRHRAMSYAHAYGTNVCGDWQTGTLYKLDQSAYTDAGNPIRRIRGFPHLISEMKRNVYRKFIADMETGTLPTQSVMPTVQLRWSDTRGASWSDYVSQPLGMAGQPQDVVQWRNLGMARDRVFELSWSTPTNTALNGAMIDLQASSS